MNNILRPVLIGDSSFRARWSMYHGAGNLFIPQSWRWPLSANDSREGSLTLDRPVRFLYIFFKGIERISTVEASLRIVGKTRKNDNLGMLPTRFFAWQGFSFGVSLKGYRGDVVTIDVTSYEIVNDLRVALLGYALDSRSLDMWS